MSEEKEKKCPSVLIDNLAILTSPKGFQDYVLGTKKNGAPRAIYDVVKDFYNPKKKKKKDKKKAKKGTSYSFYLTSKKKKKKKNKNKHWHI